MMKAWRSRVIELLEMAEMAESARLGLRFRRLEGPVATCWAPCLPRRLLCDVAGASKVGYGV